MSLIKYKKGSATGATAFVLFVICIIAAEAIFFGLREFGFIDADEWIVLAVYSALFSLLGYLMYYCIARNLVMQGFQQGIGR